MFYFIIKKIMIFIVGIFFVGSSLVLLSRTATINTTESGSLELIQLLLLSSSFIVGSAGLYHLYKKSFTNINAMISWTLWLATIAVFGRETSWGSAYGVVDSVSDRIELIAIIILMLASVIAVKFLLQSKHKWQIFKQILCGPITPIISAAIGFVLTADFFEKEYINFDHNQLMEEGYEAAGYMLFLWGHIMHVRVTSD